MCASAGWKHSKPLQYAGKASDLALGIPQKYFSDERLKEMGDLVAHSIVRGGQPRVFPIWRYAYGGFLLANESMLKEAGFDDEQIRKSGWTIDQFRAAAKAMTRDLDGDGKPDVWGFGAALVHLPHLFLNEFGPGIWGPDVARNQLLAYDASMRRWTIHPKLTEQQVEQVFLLFHQLINVDKSWNPAYLGMSFAEILDDVTMQRRLGMTFAETPLAPRLRAEIWESNNRLGVRQPPLSDLTVIWMPTARLGDRPVPRAGVMGFSVFKQIPYKGDVHTNNAMRVAYFLTHPTHLARSQLRQFRHLPPDPAQFGEIFPELLHADDRWVKFYNELMNSGIPVVGQVPAPGDPAAAQYASLSTKVDQWLTREGMDYLQQVIYQKITPHEGATQFFNRLKAVAEEREH